MIDPGRGEKHSCRNTDCLKPFYDLGKSDFSCPNCGERFDPEAVRAAETTVASSGSGRGFRRQQPTFRIVSPEEAQEEANLAGASATEDEDDDEDDTEGELETLLDVEER